MSNTLPATFEQRVKERISETIADLIPAEELDALVKAQVAHFQREELPKMIKAEITEQFKAAIKAEFAKPEYQPTWGKHGGMGASQAVKTLIEENASAVLNSLIGGMVQMTVQSMSNGMARY